MPHLENALWALHAIHSALTMLQVMASATLWEGITFDHSTTVRLQHACYVTVLYSDS